MKLFRSSSKKGPKSSSPPRDDSDTEKSAASKTGKKILQQLAKKKTGSATGVAKELSDKLTLDEAAEGNQSANARGKRRISTVASDEEGEYCRIVEESSGFDSDSTSDDEGIIPSSDDWQSDEDDDDDEDEEEHLHSIKSRGNRHTSQGYKTSHLYNLMGYCGLTSDNHATLAAIANEELKRTFSLLDQSTKIHKVSAVNSRNDPRSHESVICDKQLQLLQDLRLKLYVLMERNDHPEAQYKLISSNRTLYERYGVLKDVVGRGAYGVIKVIDPNGGNHKVTTEPPSEHKSLYAVKELQKRQVNDKPNELKDQFIDRVVSEFIISSTLNSKNVVRTVDLMVSLPPLDDQKRLAEGMGVLKVNQVMEYTSGGDLFSYITSMTDKNGRPVSYVSLQEFDCFIKQIAKGLYHMHQHGVAHCDLKLENVLVNYLPTDTNDSLLSKINLKLSDFGKSNVFKTKWDAEEQFIPSTNGPIGSGPYIAPEEYQCKLNNSKGISPKAKDCWALGIIILVLFNIRRHYYLHGRNFQDSSSDAFEEPLFEDYSSGYLWHSTEPKNHMKKGCDIKYKDKVFDEYTRTRMLASYNNTTKEWCIKRAGSFQPIEHLFGYVEASDDDSETEENKRLEETLSSDEQQLCELRKMLIYALLEPNLDSRLSVLEFCKSDWLMAIESC